MVTRRDARTATDLVFRTFRRVHEPAPALFDIWNALWEGALAAHDRRLALVVHRRMDVGDDAFEWRVRPRGRGASVI